MTYTAMNEQEMIADLKRRMEALEKRHQGESHQDETKPPEVEQPAIKIPTLSPISAEDVIRISKRI